MRKINFIIVLAMLAVTAYPSFANAKSYAPIQSIDCDESSKALAILIEDIQKGKVEASQRSAIATMLKNNIYKFRGDPEKCVLVNDDFVKVLSVDALGEFKSPAYKSTFIDLLGYLSQYQPGDIRQHAAMALAKANAYDTVPALIRAIRDKRTFMIGYRENLETTAKPTIDDLIKIENRDLREDPYSYDILRSLKSLARKKDYRLIKDTILSEQRLSEDRRSNWIGAIGSDMLRIAAGLDKRDTLNLMSGQRNLNSMQKLRVLAFIKTDRIIPELVKIIKEMAGPEAKDVSEDLKLAFTMLSALGTKQAKAEIENLSKSLNQTISFMAHIYRAKNGDEESLKSLKAKIPFLPPEGLKIEAIKLFSDIKDRNAIPVIKQMYADESLKQKTYCIWTLANLNVTDLKKDAEKLLAKVNAVNEAKIGLDITNTLKKSIRSMEESKPAY